MGRSARVSLSTPKKFVSITRRISASGKSSSTPATATPALCTTASSVLPVFESTVVTAASIDAGSVTSSCTKVTRSESPAFLNARSRGSLRLRSRIVANTRQPLAARTSVVTCPKPVDVPVIRAVGIHPPASRCKGAPSSLWPHGSREPLNLLPICYRHSWRGVLPFALIRPKWPSVCMQREGGGELGSGSSGAGTRGGNSARPARCSD